MAAKSGLHQSKVALRAAGSAFRLKQQGPIEKPKSRWVMVYELSTSRGRSVKGCRWDSLADLDKATNHLKGVKNNVPIDDVAVELAGLFSAAAEAGPARLEHTGARLNQKRPAKGQTWGMIRKLVMSWIEPGGDKARDANPFKCWRPDAYFGRNFDRDEAATSAALREYCLHTTESLQAHLDDRTQPLVPREYNGRSFEQAIQMVNRLAAYGVGIATPTLQADLKQLRNRTGKRKAPKPRFNPRDEDIETWVKALVEAGFPLRAWFFAMQATYGLRSHEVWHISGFPGEYKPNPIAIQVANFEGSSDGAGQVKTGARAALACKPEWIQLFGLDDLGHNRKMLQELHSRWPVKTAIRHIDGVEVVTNNKALGEYVSHWLNNSAREDLEIPVKLFGYYRPPAIGGKTVAREKKGVCTPYDLRHAWALRALRLTTWSTMLKAASMGHAETTHSTRYLIGVTMDHKLESMTRMLAHDEGMEQKETPTPEEMEVVAKLPGDIEAKLAKLEKLEALLSDSA